MITIGAIVLCAIIALGLFSLGAWAFEYKNKFVGGISTLAGLVFAILAFLSIGIVEVPAGHVGVLVSNGRVHEESIGSGLSWQMPLFNNVVMMNTQVNKYTFEAVEGSTKDTQPAKLTGIVSYHIDPAGAWRIYRDVGANYADIVLTTPAIADLKEITSRYDAITIIASRDEVGKRTSEMLSPQVAKYGISVDGVFVSDIGLNQAFLDAVEQKQIAQQQTLQAQNLVQKAKAEADQAAEKANGEARATIARANGEAEANRLIAASLTDKVLLSRYIDKLASDIKVMLVPTGQNTLLDLNNLIPSASPNP